MAAGSGRAGLQGGCARRARRSWPWPCFRPSRRRAGRSPRPRLPVRRTCRAGGCSGPGVRRAWVAGLTMQRARQVRCAAGAVLSAERGGADGVTARARRTVRRWPHRPRSGDGGSSYPLHKLPGLPPQERAAAQLELADSRWDERWLEAHPGDRALACWTAAGSMWRLADGQHGSDQVVQRSGQVLLGDQDNLVIDAKMVDRPSRNRAVRRRRPGPVRGVPPTGQCRWTRRCQPAGAAWCRPDRSGSPRPSSAQSAPSDRISGGRTPRWRPVGTPGRSRASLCPVATVRWQISQRVTGSWVTITGKRREGDLLI